MSAKSESEKRSQVISGEEALPYMENPQPGDHWTERLAPVLCIVAVNREERRVLICKGTRDAGNGWTWDLTRGVESVGIDELVRRCCYEHIHGGRRPYVEVWPGLAKWVVEEFRKVWGLRGGE